MDHTEDLSARVLLKHILTTELPRTPITRSASRRSSRLGNKDGGAQTPQDLLRHSLKNKIRESITRKSLPPPKRRTASVVLKKINTPATASMLFDDGDTPRHILRNILRTEPVRTPVVHEKAASDEPQPSSANSSIASKRQSTELSGLDLPDLTISNVISTAKGLSRKRPRRSLNVTAFEKRLLDEEDVEGQTEEASQDNSSLSLSSSTSLSLKTPYVDVHTEKRGLQRRVSNRRKITEEEFGAAVNRRHMGGASSFMQEERGPSETAYSEGFTLGLSKLSEPDITTDILHCNTALYAQPDAMTSNYSIVATQDKPTVMASQLQRQMSEMEQKEPSELRKEKSMYAFPTEEEAVAEPQDEEYISESQETEGGSTTNGQAQDVAVTSKSEEEEDTAVSHTGVRGDTGESEDEENVVEAETQAGATDSQTEEEEEKEDGGVDSESEEDGTTRSQSEEVPPDSQTKEEKEEEDAVDSQIEDECADDAQHEEEEIQPDSDNQEEKDEDDAVDSQSDEKEAAVDSLQEEEDADYESHQEDPAEVSVSQFKPDDDHDGEEDGDEVEEVGDEVEDDGEEVEEDDGDEVEDDGEQASEQLEGDVEHISRRAHRSGGGLIVPVAEAEGDLADGPEARLSDGKSEAYATFDLQNSAEIGSRESGPPHLTEFSNHGQRDASEAEKENSFDPPSVTQDIEDNGQMSDESPEEAAAQEEEEWEEEEEIEDVPSKTPAFVRQRRNLLRPDPLASPSVLKNIQASASDSGGLPAPAPKQARKRRTGPSRKKEGLPKSYLMSIFKHFAKTKVSADVYPVLQEIMDKFFERLAEDLETYAIHAKRKTIEVEDAELLLRRQGHVSDKVPVEVLIEKYLRMDQRKLLIPIATSGNVVFPKKRR
ncbi:uncharacterized protein cenpt [Tautogolabrus adspersus]